MYWIPASTFSVHDTSTWPFVHNTENAYFGEAAFLVYFHHTFVTTQLEIINQGDIIMPDVILINPHLNLAEMTFLLLSVMKSKDEKSGRLSESTRTVSSTSPNQLTDQMLFIPQALFEMLSTYT